VVLSRLPEVGPVRAAWFGARGRAFFAALFKEPLEYVDHDLFEGIAAESRIYGGPAVLAEGQARFTDLGDDGSCGLGCLDESETPTTTQEVLLFQRMNYARMRLARLACRLADEELDEAGLREMLAWGHRAWDLRDQLARICLALVPAMAKQARFQSMDPSELVSEGNCALVRAIMTFDCSRGYRFSTYACRAILKSFARVILRTSRYRNHFPVEYDVQYERSTNTDSKREDQQSNCVHELRVMLSQNRARLTDIEQMVISERFALNSSEAMPLIPKTLDEIGEMIGVTKERVRQIQNKALRKLRCDIEKNYLAA
jgi:RNA polymerase sigma factor (sigma-70 family)